MTGAMLRAWRARLGLTRDDAAARLGRHPRMLGYYEQGQYDIPPAMVLACVALELRDTLPGVYEDLCRRLTLETAS